MFHPRFMCCWPPPAWWRDVLQALQHAASSSDPIIQTPHHPGQAALGWQFNKLQRHPPSMRSRQRSGQLFLSRCVIGWPRTLNTQQVMNGCWSWPVWKTNMASWYRLPKWTINGVFLMARTLSSLLTIIFGASTASLQSGENAADDTRTSLQISSPAALFAQWLSFYWERTSGTTHTHTPQFFLPSLFLLFLLPRPSCTYTYAE